MGAFDVRTGKLFGFLSEDHDSQTFVDLLNADMMPGTIDETPKPTKRGRAHA